MIFFRNKFFDWGLLKSVEFEVPVIGVGNLSTGGTGKTPHVEYLVSLFKDEYKVAVLSRGYKRKTKGFYILHSDSTALKVGDEPLQISKNFPGITVAVSESRVKGIKKLLEKKPDIQLIILDDSFQHRYVKPKLNILITDYYKMFNFNFLLPCGNLREPKSQAQRAHILVVSKTPEVFSPLDRKIILKRMMPYKAKNLYFSYVKYKDWEPITEPAKKLKCNKAKTIFLLTAIANPAALEEKLKTQSKELICYHYRDHYNFKPSNLKKLKEHFLNKYSGSKVIITTQKDAMRLNKPDLKEIIEDLPVFTMPMHVEFHEKDKEAFIKKVKSIIKK